mgnify:CR=1 FL=1
MYARNSTGDMPQESEANSLSPLQHGSMCERGKTRVNAGELNPMNLFVKVEVNVVITDDGWDSLNHVLEIERRCSIMVP